jgi:hypothetical protein
MFDLVIPTRHPYHEPIVYGKVRTEFPYSENIYNMEEYNGSIRNSKEPCDIDRNFVDPCTACISSSYNIDLEIENISNDRILEAKEVLTEYVPFHAVLHTFNFVGGVHEFVESPVEEIEVLITINGSETVIAGEGQTYFNRIMRFVETNGIHRDMLADSMVVLPTTAGIAYNDDIILFCPTKNLDNVGMSKDGSAKVHILAPSPLAGTYNIVSAEGKTVTIDLSTGQPTPGSEPIANCDNLFAIDGTLNSCAFTFNVHNLILDGTFCHIYQDNLFTFSDSTQNFGVLGTKSIFDVDHGTATGAWKISIPAYSATPYEISNVNPDGSLVLIDNGTLPSSTTNISYTLLTNLNEVKTSSVVGKLVTKNRGRVQSSDSSVLPLSNIIRLENFYFKINTDDYLITGFVPGTDDQFYIDGFTLGEMAIVNLRVDQRCIDGEVGYFTHRGLKLQLPGNLESSLGIQNGANSLVVVDDGVENNGFKENFLIMIGTDAYFMAEIDGNNPPGYTTITLSGASYYWKTLAAGGTPVNATIYQYMKNGATIAGQQSDLPPHTFRTLDRAGRPVIDRTDQDGVVTGLSLPSGNEVNDFVTQTEGVSFTIQYADGSVEEGELNMSNGN